MFIRSLLAVVALASLIGSAAAAPRVPTGVQAAIKADARAQTKTWDSLAGRNPRVRVAPLGKNRFQGIITAKSNANFSRIPKQRPAYLAEFRLTKKGPKRIDGWDPAPVPR